jgi:hypothetical protein
VLAGKDTEAPHEATQAVLERLQAKRSPIDIAVFPNADHGIIEMAEQGGERVAVGQSPGYFDLLASWIRTRKLGGKFGAAILQPDTSR